MKMKIPSSIVLLGDFHLLHRLLFFCNGMYFIVHPDKSNSDTNGNAPSNSGHNCSHFTVAIYTENRDEINFKKLFNMNCRPKRALNIAMLDRYDYHDTVHDFYHGHGLAVQQYLLRNIT